MRPERPDSATSDEDSLQHSAKKTASLLDNGFQAQMLAELGQEIKEGFTGHQAGNVPFFFAQTLASGIMFFQPKLSIKLKLLHLVLALYSITRITLSLYLFYTSEVCSPNPTSNLCKTDYTLDLFFKGFILFASISAKAVKYNEKRIELKRMAATTALDAASISPRPGTLAASTHEPGSPTRPVLQFPREPFDEPALTAVQPHVLASTTPRPYDVFSA